MGENEADGGMGRILEAEKELWPELKGKFPKEYDLCSKILIEDMDRIERNYDNGPEEALKVLEEIGKKWRGFKENKAVKKGIFDSAFIDCVLDMYQSICEYVEGDVRIQDEGFPIGYGELEERVYDLLNDLTACHEIGGKFTKEFSREMKYFEEKIHDDIKEMLRVYERNPQKTLDTIKNRSRKWRRIMFSKSYNGKFNPEFGSIMAIEYIGLELYVKDLLKNSEIESQKDLGDSDYLEPER